MKHPENIIGKELTVCDAMRLIDRSELRILFVAEEGKLIGTLTDGDIRRYLYRGGKIEDPAERAANHEPRTARSRSQAAALYDSLSYIAIPVVGENGELREIYTGEDTENTAQNRSFPQLDVPVVINAGGKGTRLDPFTRVLPKPLIPVGDLPIIEHIMQQFLKYGCGAFHIIVNYKKELIKTYFRETDYRYEVSWVDEEKPLGTGGGLSLMKGKVNGTFFFSNCDTLLLSDYDSILRFHRENGNAITMICAWKNFRIPYGVVEMGLEGSIEKLREKPELSFLTNTGMYIIEPEIIDDVPADTPVTLPEIIQMEMQKGRRVAVFPVGESEWLDMGQLSELEKMRERLYGK